MIQHDIYINAVDTVQEKNGLSNVVVKVEWEFILTDGEFYSKGGGVTEFDYTNPDNFVPVNLLTEAQVSEWVKEKLMLQGFYKQIVDYHTKSIVEQRATRDLVRLNQPLLEPKVRPVLNPTTIITEA